MQGVKMSWTFVKKTEDDGGWWLKISTLEEYARYREKTDAKKYGDIFKDMMRVAAGEHETNPATTAILLYNNKYRGKKSAFELICVYSKKAAESHIEYLLKGYYLLFNRLGGWHWDNDQTYMYIHKKDLVFPEFSEKDIRITKFPYGRHYYAYIGMTEVKDGDEIKWNTYEEAYKRAKAYITK